jgi:PAS domain S-box-containing protein
MAGDSASMPRGRAGLAQADSARFAPSPLLAPLLYLAVGSLWIAGSDIALQLYVPDARTVTGYQTIKGLLFVAISALLLYAVMRMRAGAAGADATSMLQGAPPAQGDGASAGVGIFIHAIAITGVVLIIGAIVLLGYNIHDEHREAIASAQGNARNLAQVIEVETEHVFYAVDVTLLGLNDAIMMVHSSGRPRQRDIQLLLQQRLSQLPLVATLFVVDRGGTVVHASDALQGGSTDVSDRAFFTVHRDNPRHGLFVGPPMPGGPAGKNVFTVSRPWTGGDGRFQGAIVAALDPEKIEQLYGSVDTGKHGAVLLALRDGAVLACGPPGKAEAGASLADRALFREHLPRADVGSFLDAGTDDRAGRFVSYRAVPGLPLVVAVELDENEALATWLHGARVEVVVLLAFMVTMAALMTVLVSELRRRERLTARLADSERRYRVMFDLLPLPAFVRDTETLRFLAVNEAAVETYTYTREEFSRLTAWDIRPPEDHARYRAKLAALSGQMERKRDHGQHRRKDGTVMQVEVSSFDLIFAGRPARLAVINDITERIAAEQALRESEMRLQMITDNLPATIAYIDAEERYRYVNTT